MHSPFLSATLACLAASSPVLARQATLVVIAPDLGDSRAWMNGVSSDGVVLVGRTGNEACRWTTAGGYQRLGWLPDPAPASEATAISADGSVVVGWSNSTVNVAVGFRWEATVGMIALDPLGTALPVALSSAEAVGHSGQLVGGYSYDIDIDQGTLWSAPTNPTRVGIFGGHGWSTVQDIADSAPVAVGTSWGGAPPREGFVWRPGTGTVGIGTPAGANESIVGAVSANGAILFGSAGFAPGHELFRWSTNHGFEILAGVPPGALPIQVRGTNAAGTAAVGTYRLGTTTTGFYWSEGTGFRTLKWFLASRGVTNVSAATRLDPRGMSADGNVIVGRWGAGPFYSGFVARLSPTDPTLLGSDYCGPAVVNSVAQRPILEAFGSAAVADRDLVLSTRGLPRDAFGYLLASRNQAFFPGFKGSAGNLCLAAPLGRLNAPGQILSTGRFGRTGLRIDLLALPQPTGMVAVQPGETWNFQFWYRDMSGGGATSNLTSARSVQFQ